MKRWLGITLAFLCTFMCIMGANAQTEDNEGHRKKAIERIDMRTKSLPDLRRVFLERPLKHLQKGEHNLFRAPAKAKGDSVLLDNKRTKLRLNYKKKHDYTPIL